MEQSQGVDAVLLPRVSKESYKSYLLLYYRPRPRLSLKSEGGSRYKHRNIVCGERYDTILLAWAYEPNCVSEGDEVMSKNE